MLKNERSLNVNGANAWDKFVLALYVSSTMVRIANFRESPLL